MRNVLGGASGNIATAVNPKYKKNRRKKQHANLSMHIQELIINA
jgi:hypothetical protein